MLNLKIEDYLKIIFLISFISLISAYSIEYILGHQPCNLCLMERIPYGLSIILVTMSFMLKKNQKFFILLLIFVFVFSSLLSLYHFGIEANFIQESSICGLKNSGDLISKEELLIQLSKKTISCRDVTFKIFGLSLTSINVIVSLIITYFLIKMYKAYEKNK